VLELRVRRKVDVEVSELELFTRRRANMVSEGKGIVSKLYRVGSSGLWGSSGRNPSFNGLFDFAQKREWSLLTSSLDSFLVCRDRQQQEQTRKERLAELERRTEGQ
jgi:hypothetical protein